MLFISELVNHLNVTSQAPAPGAARAGWPGQAARLDVGAAHRRQ